MGDPLQHSRTGKRFPRVLPGDGGDRIEVFWAGQSRADPRGPKGGSCRNWRTVIPGHLAVSADSLSRRRGPLRGLGILVIGCWASLFLPAAAFADDADDSSAASHEKAVVMRRFIVSATRVE